MGARSFYGKNIKTEQEVFIKFLLFPRSLAEKSHFQHEVFALKNLLGIYEVSPEIYDSGELFDGEILYYVTEWIHGSILKNYLESKYNSQELELNIEIFHRVVSAVSGCNITLSHRDLHPGNIILLDIIPDWYSSKPDRSVKILDWGCSFNPIWAGFDDSPDFMFVLNETIPKELTGSFYSCPPDIFLSSKSSCYYDPGKHDAWAMGLLLYRLLVGKDLFNFKSIGDYVQSINNGELLKVLKNGKSNILSLYESATILAEVFIGLTQIESQNRMNSGTAARIIWDIRIEKLSNLTEIELNEYIKNPHDFEPLHGWKFSSYPDYD